MRLDWLDEECLHSRNGMHVQPFQELIVCNWLLFCFRYLTSTESRSTTASPCHWCPWVLGKLTGLHTVIPHCWISMVFVQSLNLETSGQVWTQLHAGISEVLWTSGQVDSRGTVSISGFILSDADMPQGWDPAAAEDWWDQSQSSWSRGLRSHMRTMICEDSISAEILQNVIQQLRAKLNPNSLDRSSVFVWRCSNHFAWYVFCSFVVLQLECPFVNWTCAQLRPHISRRHHQVSWYVLTHEAWNITCQLCC